MVAVIGSQVEELPTKVKLISDSILINIKRCDKLTELIKRLTSLKEEIKSVEEDIRNLRRNEVKKYLYFLSDQEVNEKTDEELENILKFCDLKDEDYL